MAFQSGVRVSTVRRSHMTDTGWLASQAMGAKRPVRKSAGNTPFEILFWLTVLVVGSLDYFLGVRSAYWLVYIYMVAFSLAVFGAIALQRKAPSDGGQPTGVSMFLCLGFLALLTASTLTQSANTAIVLVGAKVYLPFFIFVLAIACLDRVDGLKAFLRKAFLALPQIQLPFVLYQHFVIAPARRTVKWDAVAGSFGGDSQAGGASAVLMVFVIISIMFAVADLMSRHRSKTYPIVVILTSLIIIALGEMKAALVFLPAALLVQNLPYMIRRPHALLLFVGLAALFTWGYLQIYEDLYWSAGMQRVASMQDRINQMTSYFFDPNFIARSGEVSRGASLQIWLRDPDTDIVNRLFGYGAAASRALSTVAVGQIGLRYGGLDVGATALTQLLWDCGVVGLTMFLVLSFLAIFRAGAAELAEARKASDYPALTYAATIFLFISTIFYNRWIVDQAAEQMILATFLGLAIRQARSVKSAR